MFKISIIIPVYNVERYIARCARSLFNQTLDNIEYIFVNDCTKDKSVDILNDVLLEYSNLSSNVKILNMPVNSGQAAVRKVGIESASGEYIIHCDSDDRVDANMMEILYKTAISGNYDMVFFDFMEYIQGGYKRIKRSINANNTSDLILEMVSKGIWSVCGVLIKNEIFKRNDISYPKFNNGEDFVLTLQAAYYAKKWTYIPKPFYYYEFNPTSITRTEGIDSYKQKIIHHSNNVKIIESIFSNKGRKYRDVITILKLYCRGIISSKTDERVYRQLWKSIYPEIDQQNLLLNVNIPIILKVKYVSVRLGLFKILKQVKSIFTYKI